MSNTLSVQVSVMTAGLVMFVALLPATAGNIHPAFSADTERRFDELEAEYEALGDEVRQGEEQRSEINEPIRQQYRELVTDAGRLYDQAGDELRRYALGKGPQSACYKAAQGLANSRPPFAEMDRKLTEIELDTESKRQFAVMSVTMIATRAVAESATVIFIAANCEYDPSSVQSSGINAQTR